MSMYAHTKDSAVGGSEASQECGVVDRSSRPAACVSGEFSALIVLQTVADMPSHSSALTSNLLAATQSSWAYTNLCRVTVRIPHHHHHPSATPLHPTMFLLFFSLSFSHTHPLFSLFLSFSLSLSLSMRLFF